MPVSLESSPLVVAGSIETMMLVSLTPGRTTFVFLTVSMSALMNARSIIERVQSAPGVSSRISAFSSCRPSRVPSYFLTIAWMNESARFAMLSKVDPRVMNVFAFSP
jgi:hypothetical protein